jgi:hypothetical protein
MTTGKKSLVIAPVCPGPSSQRCEGCTGCTGVNASAGEHLSPTITVTGGINPRHQHGVEYDTADLLILTKVLGSDLGAGPMAFDAHHNGAISKTMVAHNFQGNVGEHLAVEVPAIEAGGRPRHIVVVGLGKADDISRRRMCALFNYSMALASEYKARSILIPIFPQRSSGAVMNLRGTGAVLRCLVDQKAKSGAIASLKEVRLLCAPQAKQHLEQGIAVDHTLCNQCHIPKLV